MSDPGTPLQAEIATDGYALPGRPVMDAAKASSEILAAYLRRLVWYAEGPGGAQPFRFEEVFPSWPSDDVVLRWPSASVDIAAVFPYEAHDFRPTALEETLGCFGAETVLWKTGELVGDYQVDAWCTSEVEREAVAGGMERAFSPTESRSGVLLSGVPEYFERPLRATLMSVQRLDTSDDAFGRVRRLRARIRGEIDAVHLRSIGRLAIVPGYDITDNSQGT